MLYVDINMCDFNSGGLDSDNTTPMDMQDKAALKSLPPVSRKPLFGSFLPAESILEPIDEYDPRPTIKLTLADPSVLPQIHSLCIEKQWRGTGTIPRSIHSVLHSSPLPLCSKKNVGRVCHCTELTHWVSHLFQHDIQRTYAYVIQSSNCKYGREFLKSFMLRNTYSRRGERVVLWRNFIPVFLLDNKCRMFIVCGGTFQKLFGISKAKYHRLQSEKAKRYDEFQRESPFRFENVTGINPTYQIGDNIYSVVDDDDGWCEYVSLTQKDGKRVSPAQWKLENDLPSI